MYRYRLLLCNEDYILNFFHISISFLENGEQYKNINNSFLYSVPQNNRAPPLTCERLGFLNFVNLLGQEMDHARLIGNGLIQE